MTQFVISRKHHPLRYYGYRLLLLSAVAILFWWAHHSGYKKAQQDAIDSAGGLQTLTSRISRLEEQNRELEVENVKLEQQADIERQAYEILSASVEKDQNTIHQLKTELTFYKSLVEPVEGKEKGVYLQQLAIEPAGSQNKYHYKIIIAQQVQKRKYISGEIALKLKGKQNDKAVTLSLASISDADEKDLKYRFKYFQEFSGIVTLPEDFKPDTLNFMIKSKNARKTLHVSDLSWSSEGVNYVGQ